MKCKICNNETNFKFKAKVLSKYPVKYYHCDECDFLQTESPFWLDEAYSSSINIEDTGIIARNIGFSKKMTTLLYVLFNTKSNYLDYGGGTGLFTRLMRDIGFEYYWHDPYTQNLFSRGFEYDNQDIKAISTFESFEHFVTPMKDIDKMLKITDNIIFSTNILPYPIPKPDEWWYYGLSHGQHVSFYSVDSLNYIANYFNINFYT
ncbi:class I SAM-dependent methyltransferase, partial [Halanaerobium sp.]|uniref:class I SAM-dependent methyltransferase n=1 Tax=Halanaerobium sp. TaxID=1895664 RepID=UPI000DE673A4